MASWANAINGTLYLASNPSGYITDGNTNWDNTYGFVTSAVTSVTGTAPIVSSGGTTPAISITVAKDIVAGSGLSGGEDNVLPGADADTTLTVGAGTCVTVGTDDVGVTADCIGDTQLAFNTGQALTTASSPTFAGLTLNGNLGLGVNDITVDDITADKITVTTLDPPYVINGIGYATYGAAFAGGVKEEVSGTVELNSNYVIDFKNQPIGSDLWLFYQVTDFGARWEKLQVILTPGFNGNVWYEKNPKAKTLTIYGTQKGEVSYR